MIKSVVFGEKYQLRQLYGPKHKGSLYVAKNIKT